MRLSQFMNTVSQILRSESVTPMRGLYKHLGWELRRTFGMFPCELSISHSRLLVERPSGVAALVNTMGTYDYNNMGLVQVLLTNGGGTFVDVGANLGAYSIVASEIINAVVISIEPHPVVFNALRKNASVNGRTNVVCLNVAVSDHEGNVMFTNGSDLATNRIVARASGRADCLVVQARTLDSICGELNVAPEIVKIDVEGHEHSVLRGFEATAHRANIVMVEGGTRPEVKEWMRAHRFVGPQYFHRGRKAFTDIPQRRAEDPLFIRSDFVYRLKELDFCFDLGDLRR